MVDWAKALDFDRALQNCHVDMVGDWYRDPWGWPELDWVVKRKRLELLLTRLNSSGTRRAAKITVAKENFGTRPAIVMDPVDRLIYQAMVDRLAPVLIGEISSWIYGWRLVDGDPKAGVYARNDYEWSKYQDHLRRLSGVYSAALKTDVVQCFPSIPVDDMCERLEERAGSTAIVGRVIDMLQGWDHIPDRTGLPQRCLASSVLANLYLEPVDDILNQFNKTRGAVKREIPEGRAARWMDDIWLFGSNPGRLRRAQVELQDAMHQVGLRINLAKTDVLEDPELEAQVRNLQHSGVDKGLSEGDPSPLEALIESLTESPEHADRTSVRFAATRMRQHDEFDGVEDLVPVAHRMPHAADHLARLFREAETWRDLRSWFVDHAESDWGTIVWSVAQLGTMFPSTESPGSAVRNYLAEVLNSAAGDLTLHALAAHRLSAWDRDSTRVLAREAAEKADNPILRRVLALAALSAGETRATIRKLLGEFEENEITLLMLEDTNFRRPRAKPDFEG